MLDAGAHELDPKDDYPDFAQKVAEAWATQFSKPSLKQIRQEES